MDRAALTAVQLAERWGVHPDTIRTKCRKGELPTLPMFANHRIPLVAVERIEQECGSSSTEESGPSSGSKTAIPADEASAQATVVRLSGPSPTFSADYLDKALER